MRFTPAHPNKWNGRERHKGEYMRPSVILHCTESSSAVSTVGYFSRLTENNVTRQAKNEKPIYAGYHVVFDLTSAYCYGDPHTYRAYGAAAGGNDCIHVSGAYYHADWVAGKLDTQTWLQRFAQIVYDLEAEYDIQIEREIVTDPETYKADRKRNERAGFYHHATVWPRSRKDPGWTPQQNQQFMDYLGALDHPQPADLEPIDQIPVSLQPEYLMAVARGITDGSRPLEPCTRVEAAIMALRARQLPQTK